MVDDCVGCGCGCCCEGMLSYLIHCGSQSVVVVVVGGRSQIPYCSRILDLVWFALV